MEESVGRDRDGSSLGVTIPSSFHGSTPSRVMSSMTKRISADSPFSESTICRPVTRRILGPMFGNSCFTVKFSKTLFLGKISLSNFSSSGMFHCLCPNSKKGVFLIFPPLTPEKSCKKIDCRNHAEIAVRAQSSAPELYPQHFQHKSLAVLSAAAASFLSVISIR